jgi:hypothetical protein
MALGHLLNPAPAGVARAWPLAGFALALGGLGAWRGWRHVVVGAAWAGRPVLPAAAARAAAAGAAAALLVAALAHVLVHGPIVVGR